MGADLEKRTEGIAGILAIPLSLRNVEELAAAADSTAYAGKSAWVCTTCGARGVRWAFEVETAGIVRAKVTQTHRERSPACKQPELHVVFGDADAAKLLACAAEEIRKRGRAKQQQAPAGLLPPIDNGGPWATPDMFR